MAAQLAAFFSSWSSYYGDHQAVSVTIRSLHLLALVVGGGAAVTADRRVLTSRRSALLTDALAYMHRSHRIVIAAFTVIVVTGLLMALADVSTYSVSTLFWTKMALVALLVANGGFLTFAGTRAAASESPWRDRLVAGSLISLVLWLAIVYASSWLMVAA
jgi:hypothetical protein